MTKKDYINIAKMVAEFQQISAREEVERLEEVWVKADELIKQFGCFSKDWMKNYGSTLPRVQACVMEGEVEHKSAYVYPLHKIQRMMWSGEIKNLKVQTI